MLFRSLERLPARLVRQQSVVEIVLHEPEQQPARGFTYFAYWMIVRTGAAYGWRSASGACLGIALANGVFIASAFSGLALLDNQNVVAWIELAGGLFLVYMGIMFWRSRVSLAGGGEATAGRSTWAKNLGLGAPGRA